MTLRVLIKEHTPPPIKQIQKAASALPLLVGGLRQKRWM